MTTPGSVGSYKKNNATCLLCSVIHCLNLLLIIYYNIIYYVISFFFKLNCQYLDYALQTPPPTPGKATNGSCEPAGCGENTSDEEASQGELELTKEPLPGALTNETVLGTIRQMNQFLDNVTGM